MPFIGLGAIALAMSLNRSHAVDGYGLLKNSLALQVLAQSSSSGGSSSGSSSGDTITSSSSGWSNDGERKGEKVQNVTKKDPLGRTDRIWDSFLQIYVEVPVMINCQECVIATGDSSCARSKLKNPC